MPTFSISPSIDTYPLGAPSSGLGEFNAVGVTTPWALSAPPVGSSISWVKYRAPLQKAKGALRVVDVPAAPGDSRSLSAVVVYPAFTAGQVLLADMWVRLVSLSSGTGVAFSSRVAAGTAAAAYLGARSFSNSAASAVLTPGSGWTRLTGYMTFAELQGQYATTGSALAYLQTAAVGASAGVTYTYDVGRLTHYAVATPTVNLDLVRPDGTLVRAALPGTFDDDTSKLIRQATLGQNYVVETP